MLHVCALYRILSRLLTTAAVIEAITNYREPQPTMEAMYLVMPTAANVDRIIRDYSDGRQQYAAAHLFFIDGALSQPLWTYRPLMLENIRATGEPIRTLDVLSRRATPEGPSGTVYQLLGCVPQPSQA